MTVQGYCVAPDTIDNAQPAVRAGIVHTCQVLVQEGGFDGIHYDIEPVARGDEGFVQLLSETRAALQARPLSVAAPCRWDRQYLREVSLHSQQVALMTYELGLRDSATYEKFMGLLVPELCNLLAGGQCRLVLGVPAYKETSGDHNPTVESPAAALRGINAGIRATPQCQNRARCQR